MAPFSIVLFGLILFGCWPFVPRDAESPKVLSETRTATMPADIPDILEDIFNDRLPVLHLNTMLSEAFAFHTDPGELAGAHVWGKSEEVRVANNTINSYTALVLRFAYDTLKPDPLSTARQPVWISRYYTLQGFGRTDTVHAAGRAEFQVEPSATAEWILGAWKDFRTDTLRSWGSLKIEKR